jgi:hypothetical protein
MKKTRAVGWKRLLALFSGFSQRDRTTSQQGEHTVGPYDTRFSVWAMLVIAQPRPVDGVTKTLNSNTFNIKKLITTFVMLCAFSSFASAQNFAATLQISGASPFSSFNALSQFELGLEVSPGVTVGAKLSLQNTLPGNAVLLRINPYALYKLLLLAEEQWFLTGYAGGNLNFTYAPSLTTGTAALRTLEKGRGRGGDEDDDNPVGDDFPQPTPTSALEFRVTGLVGVDGAYFPTEVISLYFGLELDADALPTFRFWAYPYLELDYLVTEQLTVALGGYLSLGSSTGYNFYTYAFYDLTGTTSLRFELSFNGAFSSALRFVLKG